MELTSIWKCFSIAGNSSSKEIVLVDFLAFLMESSNCFDCIEKTLLYLLNNSDKFLFLKSVDAILNKSRNVLLKSVTTLSSFTMI